MLFEFIFQFIIETIIIDLIGGALTRLNNVVLKLRGIGVRSVEVFKFQKLEKRYLYKSVVLRKPFEDLHKGLQGVVLELTNDETIIVEFPKEYGIKTLPMSHVLLSRVKKDDQ